MENSTSFNSTLQLLAKSTFGVADYVVFSLFLCISGAVGIFFSVRGQKNTGDYFLGGKKMKAIPVGISTGVSFMSSSSLVGGPAEMYTNGYSYMFGVAAGSIGYLIGCLVIGYILQPLQITSINEYIDKRFGCKPLTYLANIMVLLCILEYMGVCMLGSVIAFNSITGGQVSIVVALTIGAVVGTFYTSIGGLKAVVWTDVIQCGVMVAGVCALIVKSILDTPGGMAEITRLNVQYERLHPPIWSIDMTIRHTMWGLIIGFFVYWGVFSVQPACVQRLCSTRTKKDSYIVAVLASSLFLLFGLLPCWAGINIYGYYASKGCDLVAAGHLKQNEIVLYYVRDRLNYPGFQGLFIAALYAGSLSSLSSGLNSASSILWKDTIKPILRVEVSELRATLISKVIVVIFGVFSMMWCYILYLFGGLILQVASSVDASMYGAYMGIFVVGLLCRYMNYKGVLAGVVVSFSMTFGIGLSKLIQGSSGSNVKPTITERCVSELTNRSVLTNGTATIDSQCKSNTSFLTSLSYEWLTLLCLSVSFIVSLAVSGCVGPNKMKVKEEFLFPLLRRRQLDRCKCTLNCEDDSSSVGDEEEELKKLSSGDETRA